MGKEGLPFWEDISGGYIKVPKDLFRNEKYKNVSPTAKLLYGLLLDRTSLSAKKGDTWKTEKGEFYVIFKLEEIMDRMQCGHDKASKTLKELVDVGLISRMRKKRSQAYRIVVYSVMPSPEKQRLDNREKTAEDGEKTDVNNTDSNNHDAMDTDSTACLSKAQCHIDIKKQISYDLLLEKVPKEYVDSIVGVMVDTICSTRPNLRVNGNVISVKQMRDKLQQVVEMDVHYVYDRIRREKHDIQYLRGYILARLLEDEAVREVYYDRWVALDDKESEQPLFVK